ncbi:hypothetical protein ASPZODRAFT_128988 [Penicilliopsis zonata CBS 506.65]|uniref:Mannan endo-1,6-alpha-mannosidase n=1 Tax=Penicilliopsis zonata CBS 506.65 TaxID=1073090 RepID=A0A1L9ST38_9EURO|nr:hypothetical protein ASPZODRAFT_128988 [Penicilliopsis zonata CBS 506.65]OJJ50372.1 hypothetical protein ASPZODRAFT_128988 [Penicilliopsis zonata CBS 506.65]
MMPTAGGWSRWTGYLVTALLALQGALALDLNIDSSDSIKAAASNAAYGMMIHYQGNETGHIPGKLPGTWWEGGAMFMTLIQYWHFTGDDTYNEEVIEGMQWQAGDCDYMPSNWSSYLGNDDQMFWGLAAMTAAELNFPDSTDGYSWLALAQGVFNTQVNRWDTTSCNGGMRWQIYSYEAGYDMKNSISNGGLFQLAARLARYTGNTTYAEWAEKIFDWSATTPLLSNSTWNVADSTETTNDCATQGDDQWTYNYGTYIMGAAYMYNYTNGTTKWLDAVTGLLNVTLDRFFPSSHGGEIMSEILCEPTEVCNDNEIIFKGLLSTWLAFTSLVVPSTYDEIWPKLQGSAQGAAATCIGNSNNTCGVRWYGDVWDGWSGLEEQMSTTSIFSVNMIPFMNTSAAPVTSTTGGNSTSDPSAGTTDKDSDTETTTAITTGDKAGAGILTTVFVGMWIGMIAWVLIG